MDKSYRIHIRHGEFELDIEGDRAFVESYLEALFLEEEAAAAVLAPEPKSPKKVKPAALPEKEKRRRGRPPKAEGKAAKGERKRKYGSIEIDKKALTAFTAGKKAQSNKERYLLYLQFLKGAGFKEAADAHVQACFRAEGLEVPPTGRQHFRTLMAQGLVRPGTKRGLWALTDAGAAFGFGGKGGAKRAGAGPKAKAKAKAGRKPGRKAKAKPAQKAAKAPAKKAGAGPKAKAKAKAGRKPEAPVPEPVAEPRPEAPEPAKEG
ncbi:MAG: hypothetical protein ACP5VN_08535 [Acidobacteriota bacterium]